MILSLLLRHRLLQFGSFAHLNLQDTIAFLQWHRFVCTVFTEQLAKKQGARKIDFPRTMCASFPSLLLQSPRVLEM